MHRIPARLLALAGTGLLMVGCDAATAPMRQEASASPEPAATAVKFWDALATVTWNERAATLLVGRAPVGAAQGTRILAYLSVAQYRAVLAAEAGKERSTHPSLYAAAAAASATVLAYFYPGDAGALEAALAADLAAPSWPGARHQDVAAGAAIGRAVGAATVELARSDGFGLLSPGTPPVGTGAWVPSGAPARGLLGVRPFVLSSDDEIRPPAPPPYGSPAFLDALAEVRAISDTRTPEQLASAQFWNVTTAPYGAVYFNQLTTDLIRQHGRKEEEAARILAYANAAVFDALIACFDAKYAYWLIRPSKADPAITTPLGLPNHPSYPSAHACIADAFLTVLEDAFPSHRREFAETSAQSGVSRILAGLHYRFDVEAGTQIGRDAGRLVLSRGLE